MDLAEQKFEEYLYYGSNQWLLQFRNHLDHIIEERKSYTHEIYLLIYHDNDIPIEHKSIIFTTDPISVLKESGRSILTANYKYYRVYLRRFEDNYTVLLATKKEKSLIEITIDYFKMTNVLPNHS